MAEDVHPLIGKLWDVSAKHFVDTTSLPAIAQKSRYVLLGEVHDNPEHHRARRTIVEAMVKDGARPAIIMEQFDVINQRGIDDARSKESVEAAAVRDAGKLTGWTWSFYEPFVSIALSNNLPLLAGNLSRRDAFNVASKGATGALGEERVRALGIDRPLVPELHARLLRILDDGHCGKAPEKYVAGMVDAQRARDAVMAEVLARQPGPAILIAGNGHVRRDLGVPLYLSRMAPGATTLAVGFIEVEDQRRSATDYAGAFDGRFDYVWFTARQEREDPCKGLRFSETKAQ